MIPGLTANGDEVPPRVHGAATHGEGAHGGTRRGVPRGQLPAGVEMGEVPPRLPSHRREGPADVPASAPIGRHRHHRAHNLGVRPTCRAGRGVQHAGTAGGGPDLIEVAAEIDEPVRDLDRVHGAVRDPRGPRSASGRARTGRRGWPPGLRTRGGANAACPTEPRLASVSGSRIDRGLIFAARLPTSINAERRDGVRRSRSRSEQLTSWPAAVL